MLHLVRLRIRRGLPAVLTTALLACGGSTAGLGPAGVKLTFAEAVPLQLGSERTYTLKVQREGGLEGALDLSLEEQSLGFTFSPVHVPEEASEVSFTVSISDGPPPGPANVPVVVRSARTTFHVSIPVQLVGVPDGVAPDVDIERKAVVAGAEVDLSVHVDRSNGFTMGFSVYSPYEPALVRGVSPASFGYQTREAVMRVQVSESLAPGPQTLPYVIMYGGAYGTESRVAHGTFTLDVMESPGN